MVELISTNPDNTEFINLVKKLDEELTIRDGDDHDFYNQFNSIDTIKYVVIAFENKMPMGCGTIRQFDVNTMEIERMYVLPENRGRGIASRLLLELELWATELNY